MSVYKRCCVCVPVKFCRFLWGENGQVHQRPSQRSIRCLQKKSVFQLEGNVDVYGGGGNYCFQGNMICFYFYTDIGKAVLICCVLMCQKMFSDSTWMASIKRGLICKYQYMGVILIPLLYCCFVGWATISWI